jgi:hypothetical protein
MELTMIIASITRRFDFDLEYPGQQVSKAVFIQMECAETFLP